MGKKTRHPDCEQVRLVDRCVHCNPGYLDSNQSREIYLKSKRYGWDLARAEQEWLDENAERAWAERDR